jgi:lactate 2-monooxygenase
MGHHFDQPFPEYGRRRQQLIFVHGLGHKVSRVPVDFPALEERARRVMTKRGFAYVAGGAGAQRTMAVNRAAFDRWRIVPRVLCDVSRRDLSLTLFGERLPAPLILAPIGVLEMVHALSFLHRAEACGCRALVVTLDNTLLGWRPRDLDLGSLPFLRGMGIAQ